MPGARVDVRAGPVSAGRYRESYSTSGEGDTEAGQARWRERCGAEQTVSAAEKGTPAG